MSYEQRACAPRYTFPRSNIPTEIVILSGAVSSAKFTAKSKSLPLSGCPLPLLRGWTAEGGCPHIDHFAARCRWLVHVFAFGEAGFSGREDVALAGDPDVERGEQEDAHD